MNILRIWVGLGACLVLSSASAVQAQEVATSFEQLRVLVKPGDRVTLTDAAGVETRGKILAFSPSSLAVEVGGVTRDFAESDVNRVRQRRHGSLARGAKWGLAAGLGLSAFAAIGIATEDEWDDYNGTKTVTIIGGTALFAGLGVAAGVGVSALIRRDHDLYIRGGVARQGQVTLSPVLTADRKGMAISLGF